MPKRKPDLMVVIVLLACAGVVISTTAYGGDETAYFSPSTAEADGLDSEGVWRRGADLVAEAADDGVTVAGDRETALKLGYSTGLSGERQRSDRVDHYGGRAGYGHEPEGDPSVYLSLGTSF